ncbi:hypothetical protein DFH07DRAFT_868009 [Mycena maculata]|uniref:Aminoglycoside phosphotransferase domain-containing protein n=1 Tax=Mycena maculata TaxID=230809 RepID=A0AAD7J8L0_9AGAR|nr:hypothetical protein DFH07DRAFT_868009 [Mycena maculata]
MADPASKSTDSSSSSYSWWDEWPQDFDGTGLFERLTDEPPLFRFSVQDILDEVKDNVGSRVIGVPCVSSGSNYFGMHVKLDDGKDTMLRIRRCDVNWPRYDGFPIDTLAIEVEFEAATYRLLRAQPEILASKLLYYRGPVQRKDKDPTEIPKDLVGRQLFVFEKAEGANNVWPADRDKKLAILTQCASMRAALFRFELPLDFVKLWLPQCSPNPKISPDIITPTRQFVIDFLLSKVQEMIKNEGDMIGWESDHNTVGPIAFKAKGSLLRLIPLIFPPEGVHACYRLVLEHGDFGIHNMTITDSDTPAVTSLYDWETGHIVPAILSDPQIATHVDFELDGDGVPVLSRLPDGATAEYIADYEGYAKHYFKVLDECAPEYIPIVKAGKDARHIWFALKAWRGEDPEGYFGTLGSWADGRWRELAPVNV